jgi:sugar lactone lactonase YvrE
LLAASADGWCLIDGLDGVPRAGPLRPWPGARPVALCNGPAGDLWACAAVMDGGSGPRWQVGRFTPGGALEVAWQTSEALDALAWDARGEWLYGVAGGSGTILMMGTGQSALRRLATVPKGSGRISGVAVDAQGGVWAALQDGWGVVRFSPDGALDRVIGLPVPGPTDLALGGADGATLFITSARHSVSIESLGNAPLSGRIFAVNLDENGQIPARDGHSTLSIEK